MSGDYDTVGKAIGCLFRTLFGGIALLLIAVVVLGILLVIHW